MELLISMSFQQPPSAKSRLVAGLDPPLYLLQCHPQHCHPMAPHLQQQQRLPAASPRMLTRRSGLAAAPCLCTRLPPCTLPSLRQLDPESPPPITAAAGQHLFRVQQQQHQQQHQHQQAGHQTAAAVAALAAPSGNAPQRRLLQRRQLPARQALRWQTRWAASSSSCCPPAQGVVASWAWHPT
jgi:hypothetical protein